MHDELSFTRSRIRRLNVASLALVAVLFGGVGSWAALATFEGAVVTSGELLAEGNRKRVQHPHGGVIADILVREGDRVAAGATLLRLDDTAIRSALGTILVRIAEYSARQARLEAELVGADSMALPSDMDLRDGAVAAEMALFNARRTANTQIAEQFQQKVVQLREQVSGLEAQRAARQSQRDLAVQELEMVEGLFEKGLVTQPRLLALKRVVADADGELGRIDAAIAAARSAIAETELRAAQSEMEFAKEVAAGLSDVRGQLAELAERRIAAEDQLARTEITAPIDGIVHRLAIHTLGAVVQPGSTMLEIVPTGERLIAESRVSPEEVDRISVGAPARIRIRAGNQRVLPEVAGRVSYVSADAAVDERTGVSYFLVRAELPADAGETLDGMALVPGMGIDTFIQTGARSPMSYMAQPLTEQINRAWRER